MKGTKGTRWTVVYSVIICDEMGFSLGYLQRYWSRNEKDNNRLHCPRVSEARGYN
jgi:hypothetical protein